MSIVLTIFVWVCMKNQYNKEIFAIIVGGAFLAVFATFSILCIDMVEKLTPIHILFGFIVTIPVILNMLAIFILDKNSLGRSLRTFGTLIISKLAKKESIALQMAIIALGLVVCHWIVSYLHYFYYWGAITSVVYNIIALTLTWFLITFIKEALQRKIIIFSWAICIVVLSYNWGISPLRKFMAKLFKV